MSQKFNYVVRHVSVLFYKAAFELQIYEGQLMAQYCHSHNAYSNVCCSLASGRSKSDDWIAAPGPTTESRCIKFNAQRQIFGNKSWPNKGRGRLFHDTARQLKFEIGPAAY
jgi:hypothetical protein